VRLKEADFLTQMSYDAGHFPATDSSSPVFSKNFWKSLVHETRTAEDRTAILASRKLVFGNPNILPGIYTQPDTWLAWEGEDDRRIDFKLRQNNFAHDGANRPMDAFRGIASVWWNIMYCKAARRIGISLECSHTPEDWKWYEANEDAVEQISDLQRKDNKRQLWIQAMTVELRNSGIDILGSGGEFIILNPAVIDWERTREACGFVSKAQKAKERLEERFVAVESAIRALLQSNQDRGVLAFGMVRRIVTKRAIVLQGMILPTSSLAESFLSQVAEVAKENDIRLGMTASTDVAGKPSDYGFVQGSDGIYWHA
jgi:hypothetical protein